ncbi:MAG: rRNA maturation RNase YbeY [Planctomycetes bacterium]|nr:rRNA maturation RNase YbeY [Planctomycetota bacterium]MCH8968473.1 rRNA maturation RNase YbeY [Planctomycetota bacterium]
MNEDDPYDIQVHNKHADDGVDPSMLQEGIREALRRFDTASADVSVAVVSDAEIAELHEKYMNIKGATDVLAFDLAEKHHAGANGRHVEGEIVVSADTAKRRAEERAHPVAAELALYVVHGTLHLLGMDDATEQEAMKMHKMEDEILTAIGVGRVYGG